MRRGLGVFAAVLAAWAAGPARAPAQDSATRYWPLREISFPVAVDRIQQANPRPVKLRFYVARDRGRFERVAEKALGDLEVINPDRNLRGFRYQTPADGEYEFALQGVYADGTVRPRDADLSAEFRVVVDTHPPSVRLTPYGSYGVEWEVQDENLRPDGVELQVRYPRDAQWHTVTTRAFSPRDRYTWTGLEPGRQLEVRVVARDRAGLEMASRVVTLPTGRDGGDPVGRPTNGSGFGHPNDVPAQPQIDFVNSYDLTIESKLTRVTRSGVKAAHLWVNDGKGGWKLAKSQPENIAANAPDPTIRIAYKAERDGLYGFIVIPENGAGGRQPDPRADDPAQFLIEVDTERPFVQVQGVKVSPGGAVGPRVEIDWKAVDKNLWPEPIVLEYCEQKAGGEWKPITPGKVANSGRYVWEVEDKNLWHFYVRATATDKAGNQSQHVYEKEVVIDLEKPAATIERVQGGPGGGSSPQPRQSERPVEPSPPPASSPSPVIPANPPPVGPVPSGSGDPPPVPKLPERKDPGK